MSTCPKPNARHYVHAPFIPLYRVLNVACTHATCGRLIDDKWVSEDASKVTCPTCIEYLAADSLRRIL